MSLSRGGISDPTHDPVFSSIIKPSSVLFQNVVDITGTERRSDTDATKTWSDMSTRLVSLKVSVRASVAVRLQARLGTGMASKPARHKLHVYFRRRTFSNFIFTTNQTEGGWFRLTTPQSQDCNLLGIRPRWLRGATIHSLFLWCLLNVSLFGGGR